MHPLRPAFLISPVPGTSKGSGDRQWPCTRGVAAVILDINDVPRLAARLSSNTGDRPQISKAVSFFFRSEKEARTST